MQTLLDTTARRIREDIEAGCIRISPGQYRNICAALGWELVTSGGMATGRYINTGNAYSWRAQGVTYRDIVTREWWSVGEFPRERIAAIQELRRTYLVTSQGYYWEL